MINIDIYVVYVYFYEMIDFEVVVVGLIEIFFELNVEWLLMDFMGEWKFVWVCC